MPSTDTAWLMRPSAGSILCRPSPRGTRTRSAQSRKPQTQSPTWKRALREAITRATTRETIRRAYAAVKTEHEQMEALKHSLEGQRDAANPLFPQ